ncbi:hypothetical protein CH341_03920 [Rhodoplanes roseus]|uniref:Uncharacterized protein n=2 Tax=Rhodoplanes roseus TaxID=29409 RepID=A0A327L4W6_9BRAD|nr:hypothetical protein CH341_03920 [Rhodoplanes roseus]
MTTPSGRTVVATGLLLAAAAVALLAWVAGGPAAAPVQPWIGDAAAITAAVLLLAGIAVLVDGLGDIAATAPLWLRAIALATGVAVFASFAVLVSWLAFGPGPRVFASIAALLPSGDGRELAGRCVVGTVALIGWALTLLVTVLGAIRLAVRPKPPLPAVQAKD